MIVWIGHDRRWPKTYEACRNSIRHHNPEVQPLPLSRALVEGTGLYWRADPKAATEFSLSRFLVPALMRYQGWALFCDGDFVFTRPLEELFALADPEKAVMVVQHSQDLWVHGDRRQKMDGQEQVYYPRKWWSALVLWNCGHTGNGIVTPARVNSADPGWLHRFGWLHDTEIGALPADWHWLDGYSKPVLGDMPAGIHFTRGTPELADYENTEYAWLWRQHA
jgi:hypothetical protein